MTVIRSLYQISVDAVLDNIDCYDKNCVKLFLGNIRSNKLDAMWNEAKNHHLHCDGKGNDHIDKLWATLPCLINSLLYINFDTSDLTGMRCKSSTLSNSRFQELIRCLASNTPNLKELIIYSPRDLKHSLAERELASIAQLKNLKTLIIENICVQLSGLSELTHQCEKLEKINVSQVVIDVEPSCDAFKDTFMFIVIYALDLHDKQLNLRLESTLPTFPVFQGVGRYIKLILAPKKVAQINLVRGFTKLTEIMFSSTELENVERLDEFPHFPEVKFATLSCPGTSAHARCFLKRNGKTLQKLVLDGIDAKENVTFNEIFRSCPNLESLELCRSNLTGNDAPVEAMRRLKRFEWRHLYSGSTDPVAFSSILSAPLLEEIYINLPKIDFSDNATVIARIKRCEILRNLKKFEMVDQRRNTDYKKKRRVSFSYDPLKDLKNAIDSVISV